MKRIIWFLLISIFFSLGTRAQTFVPIHNAQAIDWLKGVKYLRPPFGITPTLNSTSTDPGPLFYNTIDSSLYAYTGYQWLKVGVSASGSSSVVYAGYGLSNVNDSTIKADSATLANYFLRRKDSTDAGYYPYSSNPKNYLTSALAASTYATIAALNLKPDSLRFYSSQTIDTVKEWKSGSATIVGYIDRQDPLIEGGVVSYSDTALIYHITPSVYYINGVRKTSVAQRVTLAAADPTDPTIYTFYLDDAGLFGAIRGTPSPDPVSPQVDEATQLYRAFAYVDAGATTPTGITSTMMYNENTGPPGEFTWQSVGGTTNFGGTTNPFSGTKTIDIGSFTTGKTITGISSSSFQTTTYSNGIVKMYIRLKAAFANSANINLQFLNGSTVVSNSIALAATHGFNKATVGTYQNITVLFPSFTFTGNTVDRLRITFTGSNASGLYIDYAQLQAGTNNSGSGGPWEPVITPANLPNGYWNRYKNFVAFNTDSIPEGSTNFWATSARVIGIMSGQNISIFNNNSFYQTATNLHDSLVIVNARIDSLAALRDTTQTTTGVGTGANLGKPLFVVHGIATNVDTLALDTLTIVATKSDLAGLGGGTYTGSTGITLVGSDFRLVDNAPKINVSDSVAMLAPYLRVNVAAATYQPIITTSEQEVTASGSLAVTFSSVPATYSDYIIFRNGVANESTTDYTTSGNVVTFVTGGLVTGDRVVMRRTK